MHPSVMPYVTIVYHTIVMYIFLILMLRFVNKRQMGQLTILDLVIVILLGSAVETAMVNANTSLMAGVVCAVTLLITNRALSFFFCRSKHWRHIFGSGPILLVHNGQFVEEHLRRAGMTEQDVLQALRQRECNGLSNVRMAVMESDGAINVVKKKPIAKEN